METNALTMHHRGKVRILNLNAIRLAYTCIVYIYAYVSSLYSLSSP